MASQLIAHVAAWYIPTGQPLVNDMDGLTIDGAYRLEAQRMHAELERRARGQPLSPGCKASITLLRRKFWAEK